ncbi:MAG: winged helix-turn-helix domain-containing protein [Bradyrhizobiaceae bacterium]|nr:winged helix-turn-helix domain-containing protein [Bradyrhizobiaceae bacterium]
MSGTSSIMLLHGAMRTRILVIEDLRSVTPAPWEVVFDSEYEVEIANRADQLMSHIRDFVPHLMIINSERRRRSNAKLCRELRHGKESARTPILLLTDRAEESAESLDAGADDCLVKPISLREFHLRIRGLLRRAQSACTLRAADIVLDLDRFRVTRAGRDVHLAPLEFKLLELLMRTPGRPVPRDDLISGAWPHARIDKRTVNVNIMRLRKALMRGRRSDPIGTVRGVGYYLSDGNRSALPQSDLRYEEPDSRRC